MKTTCVVAASVACLSLADARNIVVPNPEYATFAQRAAVPIAAVMGLAERALPESPSGGYAPANVACPATRPTIRRATELSPNETAWLQIRRNNTVEPMINLLTRANISGFDAASYIRKYQNNATALPNIAISLSGGGYRALMNGAGFVAAADNRTINSTGTGQIGGLLQATTYLAGLSGGNWMVGSMYMNNFSSVQTMQNAVSGSNLWQFQNSIFEGPKSSGLSILNTASYFKDIYDEVQNKNDAGYNTTITDYWGRALSYQLVNATDGGPAYTWSSIAEAQNFISGNTPFPIVVSDGRSPGTLIVSLNSTVFEFNPFELGSWDPSLYAFAPVKYIGSPFTAGVVPSGQQCVEGFDQGGFVMGTSSSLFNEAFLELNSSSSSSILVDALTHVTADIGKDEDDIAAYKPNPFYQFNNNATAISRDITLSLTDGGEDGQNIPLDPLIQPNRHVDVIFAIDSSADTNYNWPNGTSMVATYQRSMSAATQNGTAFPAVPDQNTFVNLGLNKRPTFFGCNVTNSTNSANNISPLIVYVPNAPYIVDSNLSTYNLSYTITQRNLIIQNGYDVATLGNGTVDANWPVCLSCAILSRSFYKTGTAVPQACQSCFQQYCWNGSTNATLPNTYTPSYLGVAAVVPSWASQTVRSGILGGAVALAASILLL